jgi:hypothetical protein
MSQTVPTTIDLAIEAAPCQPGPDGSVRHGDACHPDGKLSEKESPQRHLPCP